MNLPIAFALFLDPLPVWNYWPWMLIPLAAGVSIVYKSIKCKSMATVPKEAAGITFWILFGMTCAAAALWGVVTLVSHG